MNFYFCGNDALLDQLKALFMARLNVVDMLELEAGFLEAGVIFLDTQMDDIDDAVYAASEIEGLKLVLLGDNFLGSSHSVIQLPISSKALVDCLSDQPNINDFIKPDSASEDKTLVAQTKISKVIDEVFDDGPEESLDDSLNDDLAFSADDESQTMTDVLDDKEEIEGALEFNIPEKSEDGLSLSSEGDDDLHVAEIEQSDNEGDLDFGDDSIDGLSIGEIDDAVKEEYEKTLVDMESPSDISFSDSDSDVGLSLSEEGDEPMESLEPEIGDVSFDETSEKVEDGGDDLLASDDLLEEADDLLDASAELDVTGEIPLDQIMKDNFSNEFSDIDLTNDLDDDASPTKVVDSDTLSRDIDADELDQTLNQMLFSNDDESEKTLSEVLGDVEDASDLMQLDEEKDSFDLGEQEETHSSKNLVEQLNEETEEEIHFDQHETAQTIIVPEEVDATKTVYDDSENLSFSAESNEAESVPENIVEFNHRSRPENLSASQYTEDELLRLQGTIRQLRDERHEFLDQIEFLKKEAKLKEQDSMGLKAELDELKIEISILKKRHLSEVEELRYQWKLSEEKKDMYEQRAKNSQKEVERLGSKVRLDINQVKQREKELESQLELISMDSESKVKSRDMKILELKRKIDALEFNMENVAIREQKLLDDKVKTEDRLNKIMRTLRGSIKLLEDDIEYGANEQESEMLSDLDKES
ncbi:hypothetical protein HBN50_10340 [Halobacteriovorax sp. GB3]|uniref:hypothetical protein n=1 Tax=Halobacteriovorax sp. GB3 TaxID=2719615 RepID=UPI00235EAC2E|nr:hypothetical protein [Halobacteriovorax sp. GB3]MDD0853500.1 hypothetical protein [Halobacteriovorax sp. GB3]